MAKLIPPILCTLFLTCRGQAVVNLSRYNCSSNSSFAPNSTYHANLKILLVSLSSIAAAGIPFSQYSVGGGDDTVYGGFLCKGDDASDCRGCVGLATTEIARLCPTSRVSILYYDECMLRYSDQKFFSMMQKEPLLFNFNGDNIVQPDQFMNLLTTTLTRLIQDNIWTKSSFSHREAKFVDGRMLYIFGQCTPDLSAMDCGNCVSFAARELESLEWGRIGGRVLLPSCFIRYELYPFYQISSGDVDQSKVKIIMAVAASSVGILLIFLGVWFFLKRSRKRRENRVEELPMIGRKISDPHSLQFHLTIIEAATNNFSTGNKIGEGGFGPVYKGILSNGQEIAVKRLSRSSGQGVEEFKNEVELVAKLQHRNLVRLLGYSVEREETILVYEFVPNGSLDHVLFEPELTRQLDWSTRHEIVLGVARGLLYLHKDSQLRIIHRDIKASNILLDADMNPKISDFGLARIFGDYQTQASTNRIVGTFGYLSPEYMTFGEFSVKSDVFSFGILVLEIITGKKNTKFVSPECDDSLLGYVWKHWSSGTPTEAVDPALGSAYSVNEVIRCIRIGLICVQDHADDRPTMDSVLLMLNGDAISIPVPQQPLFFYPSSKDMRRRRDDLRLPDTRSASSWSVRGDCLADVTPR